MNWLKALFLTTTLALMLVGCDFGDQDESFDADDLNSTISVDSLTGTPTQKLAQAIEAIKKAKTSDFKILIGLAYDAYDELLDRKAEIESNKEVFDDKEIVEAVQFYVDLKNLYRAQSLLEEDFPLSTDQLKSLDLILIRDQAQMVVDSLSQEAVAKHRQVFDINLMMTLVGKNKARLSISQAELVSIRLDRLISNPSKEALFGQIRFEGLKLNFDKEQMLNSFLYSDQKIAPKNSLGVNPLLVGMKNSIEDIYKEDAFRKELAPFVHKIFREYLDSRGGFEKQASGFVQFIGLQLINHVDPELAPVVLQAPENFTKVFLSFEEDNVEKLTSIINERMQRSPVYFSKLKPVELRMVLKEMIEDSVNDLMKAFLFRTLFRTSSMDQFSDLEQSNLAQYLYEFSIGVLSSDKVLPQAAVDEALRNFKNPDVFVATNRYALSKALIRKTQYIDQLRAELLFIKDHKTVPESRLPDVIDPIDALMAIEHTETLPVWVLELVRDSAKVAKSKKTDQDRMLFVKNVFRAPEEIQKKIQKILKANPADKESVKKAHQEQMHSSKGYRWESYEKRLGKLLEVVKGKSAKDLVMTFLELNKITTITGTKTLNAGLSEIFAQMTSDQTVSSVFMNFVENKAEKIEKEVQQGVDWMNDPGTHRMLETMIVSDDQRRSAYIRKMILSDQTKYVAFINSKIGEIKVQYPVLFYPVKLPSEMKDDTAVDDPVPFHVFLSALLKASRNTNADIKLGGSAFTQMDPQMSKDYNFTDRVLKTDLSLEQLTKSALQTLKDESSDWQGIARWFTELNLIDWDKEFHWYHVYNPVLGAKVSPNNQNYTTAYQSHIFQWPTELKARDVLGAVLDQQKSITLQDRTERMLTALYLQPFLMASADSNDSEIGILLDPKSSVEDLVNTKVVHEIVANSEGLLDSGISHIQEEYAVWTKRYNNLKIVTGKLQEKSHILFPASVYLLEAREGASAMGKLLHELSTNYMMVSAAVDFTADFLVARDYYLQYRATQDFSLSGALGKGIIDFTDADSIRENFGTHLQMLVERFPMDASFVWGVAVHDWIPNRKATANNLKQFYLYKVREYIYPKQLTKFMKKNAINFDEFAKERDELSNKIAQAVNIGLELGISKIPTPAGIWSGPKEMEGFFQKQIDAVQKIQGSQNRKAVRRVDVLDKSIAVLKKQKESYEKDIEKLASQKSKSAAKSQEFQKKLFEKNIKGIDIQIGRLEKERAESQSLIDLGLQGGQDLVAQIKQKQLEIHTEREKFYKKYEKLIEFQNSVSRVRALPDLGNAPTSNDNQ